jgi:catechol 2,3-dioxygenase-like lactoylglutathione lyase family enzyme
MFSHVMVGSNDMDRSRSFYDALFAAMGGKPGRADDKGRLSYVHKGAVFMVSPPIDGAAATHGNGSTIGFGLDSPERVDAWHQAGVAAGGTAIEDPPGVRRNAFGALYLAYLRDPDGNKLCGLYRVLAE